MTLQDTGMSTVQMLGYTSFVADFTYFKSTRSQIQIWGELVLGSQNNTSDETNGVNDAVMYSKEAVQFSAFFVMSCQILTKFVERQ